MCRFPPPRLWRAPNPSAGAAPARPGCPGSPSPATRGLGCQRRRESPTGTPGPRSRTVPRGCTGGHPEEKHRWVPGGKPRDIIRMCARSCDEKALPYSLPSQPRRVQVGGTEHSRPAALSAIPQPAVHQTDAPERTAPRPAAPLVCYERVSAFTPRGRCHLPLPGRAPAGTLRHSRRPRTGLRYARGSAESRGGVLVTVGHPGPPGEDSSLEERAGAAPTLSVRTGCPAGLLRSLSPARSL